MNKIQAIISIKPGEYVNGHHLSFQQLKVINNIISCQTSNMGSHRLTCECGHEKIVNNSCHNRHCPICGNFKKEMWIQKQQESVIPSHYFHLVFTVPSELRAIAYFNQSKFYNLMYHAASKTILDLSKSQLDVIPGFSLILHTWSQTLIFHPHLHCILVGGGISLDQKQFKSFKKKYFLPIRMLSRVYRAKLMEGLKSLYHKDELVFPNNIKPLEQPKAFQVLVDNLFNKDWVVYSKRVFKSAKHVIKYLGRYTHKIAIYANRITDFDEHSVTFQYHDRCDNNQKKRTYIRKRRIYKAFSRSRTAIPFHENSTLWISIQSTSTFKNSIN